MSERRSVGGGHCNDCNAWDFHGLLALRRAWNGAEAAALTLASSQFNLSSNLGYVALGLSDFRQAA